MAQLNPYLTFNGNCREAMEFYKECLGGELYIQTVGESPMAEHMPDMKDKVMHSQLKKDEMVIMASDLVMGGEVKQGNNVTLTISGGTRTQLTEYFTKLSAGGKVGHELKEEFFGFYGDCTDKFGMQWAFQTDSKE